MKKLISILLSVLAIFLSVSSAQSASIKLAIIAPEGSAWANVMKEMGDELVKRTAGRWDLKLYAGGVSGDEKVVLKKMQIGQIDAAGFTGVGLGDIFPSIRVLELPFMFDSTAEVDYVVGKLMPDIQKGFADKGYEFLGWAEAGFVYIFSNKPIGGIGDMKGVKMWMWEGDPLAKKMYEVMEVVPVPLSIPDVLMALQTNMVNGVYAPPLGAIAMQWFSKTKYMSDVKLVNSIGAIVMTKQAFAKMGPEDQKILKELAEKYSKKLVDLIRKDNEKSIEVLKGSGIEVVKVDGKNKTDLVEKSKTVWSGLAGTLYSSDLLNKTVGFVGEFRTKG